MNHIDRLKEWAVTLDVDAVTQTPNKLTIPDALFDKGWLKDNVITNQHINELFNLITGSILEIQGSAQFPVGSVRLFTVAVGNPATILGYGTWNLESTAAGINTWSRTV